MWCDCSAPEIGQNIITNSTESMPTTMINSTSVSARISTNRSNPSNATVIRNWTPSTGFNASVRETLSANISNLSNSTWTRNSTHLTSTGFNTSVLETVSENSSNPSNSTGIRNATHLTSTDFNTSVLEIVSETSISSNATVTRYRTESTNTSFSGSLSLYVEELLANWSGPRSGEQEEVVVSQFQSVLSEILEAGEPADDDSLRVLMTVPEALAATPQKELSGDLVVELMITVGDIASVGLVEDEVRTIVARGGTELSVVAPSTVALSQGFVLGSCGVPPLPLSGVIVQVLSWRQNPYHQNSSNISVTAVSINVLKDSTVIPLVGLEDLLTVRVEEVADLADERTIQDRTLVFWNETTSAWSSTGVETTGANLTAVSATSSHATSFAIMMTYACPVCGATRLGFLTSAFQMTVSGWLLLALLPLVYSPFVYCHYCDREDWIAVPQNKARYFRVPWKRKRRQVGWLDRTLSGLARGEVRGRPVPTSISMENFEGPVEATLKSEACHSSTNDIDEGEPESLGCDVHDGDVVSTSSSSHMIDLDAPKDGKDEVEQSVVAHGDGGSSPRVPVPSRQQDTVALDGAGFSRTMTSFLLYMVPRWLKYSLHARRTERFAVLITAVCAASFFQCLLFVTGPGCYHEPTPTMCQETKSFLDMQRIFEALWGIVFSIPCAYILNSCFYRPTTHDNLTRIEIAERMRKWVLKARGAWSLFLLVHFFLALFFLRFVTFFSSAVLWKWISGSILAAVTDCFSSPLGRTLVYLQAHFLNLSYGRT
uniref:Uncharacterized protein n=1 Tax=Noctiluca scintillans TaxID=2966 RepID=A0A7S1FHW3_NOCSC